MWGDRERERAWKRGYPKVHEAGDDATWKHQRWTTEDFLAFLVNVGKELSPLFTVFGVFNTLFKVDWLHAVDQGVGADFLGNLFAMLLAKMTGSNKHERVDDLWKHMQKYYDANGIQDRMPVFDVNSIGGKKNSPPKLRSSAACCRALIPFGREMAERYLSDACPLEHAAKVASKHLHLCYESLSCRNELFRHEVLQSSSTAFALQYDACFRLAGDGIAWRVKPKMHLFLELCHQETEPNLFWCYRDEDFGGTVAKSAKMKGMWKKLSSFSGHSLDMFAMKNDAPRLLLDIA